MKLSEEMEEKIKQNDEMTDLGLLTQSLREESIILEKWLPKVKEQEKKLINNIREKIKFRIRILDKIEIYETDINARKEELKWVLGELK